MGEVDEAAVTSMPVSGSSAALLAELVATYGPCTCLPAGCAEGDDDCAPCARLDPYWECLAVREEANGE